MATLTKQEVSEIIKKAPTGTSPAGIVAALRQKGFQLEGYQEQTPTPAESAPKTGMLKRAGSFIASDTLGIGAQDKSGGFLKDVYQSTLGSKGLAGVAQLPGKVIGAVSEYAPVVGKNQGEDLRATAMDIDTQATNWLKKANATTDPSLKAKYTKLGMDLVTASKNIGIETDNLEKFTDTTGKEALGTTINAATTVASSGALSPSKIIVGQGGKAFAKSAAVNATKNAVIGAGYGAGDSLGDNKDYKQVAKDAFISGLTSATVQTGISTAGVLGRGVAEKSTQALMDKALKISKTVIEKGRSPSKQLLDNGTWGTLGSMYKQVGQGIEQAKSKIAPKLAKTPGGLSEAEVRNGIFTSLKKEVGDLYSDKQINQMVNSVPLNAFKKADKYLPWKEVNSVRSQLDRELGDRFWMSNANPTLAKRASEAATNFMRNSVKKATGTTVEFAEEAKLITARKALSSALAAAQKNYGIGFTDVLFGLAGFSQGETMGERVKNAAFLVGSEKLARSSLLKSGTAQILNKATKTVSKTSQSGVGRAIKTGVTKAISKATLRE